MPQNDTQKHGDIRIPKERRTLFYRNIFYSPSLLQNFVLSSKNYWNTITNMLETRPVHCCVRRNYQTGISAKTIIGWTWRLRCLWRFHGINNVEHLARWSDVRTSTGYICVSRGRSVVLIAGAQPEFYLPSFRALIMRQARRERLLKGSSREVTGVQP